MDFTSPFKRGRCLDDNSNDCFVSPGTTLPTVSDSRRVSFLASLPSAAAPPALPTFAAPYSSPFPSASTLSSMWSPIAPTLPATAFNVFLTPGGSTHFAAPSFTASQPPTLVASAANHGHHSSSHSAGFGVPTPCSDAACGPAAVVVGGCARVHHGQVLPCRAPSCGAGGGSFGTSFGVGSCAVSRVVLHDRPAVSSSAGLEPAGPSCGDGMVVERGDDDSCAGGDASGVLDSSSGAGDPSGHYYGRSDVY